jgi:hypothetical protein
MTNKKIIWLIYTVFIGLIPIIARFLVWFGTAKGVVELFSTLDFVAFGLVLHISSINEIEHAVTVDQSWKTIQVGTSVIFISMYCVLFALALLGDHTNLIDRDKISYFVFLFAFVSFLLCYTVFYRLSLQSVCEEVKK